METPHVSAALVAIARPCGSIPHMSRMEAIVRVTSVCAGNAPKLRTCTWSLVLDVEEADCGCESPHGHGDCSYRRACGRHLPLWSGPTNMRQPGSQSKLLHVKANVVPSHIRVLHGTILNVCAKTRSLGKIGLCLDSRHLGRVQAHQGKQEEMAKIKMARGCQWHPTWVLSHPHMVATLGSALCNPWTPTRLQPYARNLNPLHNERNPKATKTMAVNQPGWHRKRHPSKLGYTQHLLSYTQTAVMAAVRLRILIKMAVDTDFAITVEEGWFGHDSL